MLTAFKEADKDGNGFLERGEIKGVLEILGAGDLQLSEKDIHTLMVSLDEDDDGA